MAYGFDVSVYVEDKAGDLGAPDSTSMIPGPWWLSPDVVVPAHPGEATQGVNDVQIRVHAHEEPILEEKVTAEVYVGKPGFVLSPTNGTKRIDPGTLLFRPAGVAGSEPVLSESGATLSFPWTPSSATTAIDGPGHRCLIVRAFPVGVTPPSSPFDVPNEQHEAQHNIEILATTTASATMSKGGAGTRKDPRKREKRTGLWWEELTTTAVKRRGKRFVVWAFDPKPSRQFVAGLGKAFGERTRFGGFSKEPPGEVSLEVVDARGEEIDPRLLLKKRGFAKRSGLGEGVFAEDRLLGAASMELGPRTLSRLRLRFDHSNLKPRTAVILHGAQWREDGTPEGGMTVVALAPS
ncbi:MAG TPA: hypothetical protein VF545_05685 [Thermoleophilaceae bacterium]|jgi:hypothetical protein